MPRVLDKKLQGSIIMRLHNEDGWCRGKVYRFYSKGWAVGDAVHNVGVKFYNGALTGDIRGVTLSLDQYVNDTDILGQAGSWCLIKKAKISSI